MIPAPLRKSLNLKLDDTLVVESDGGSLLVRGYDQVLREVQAAFASGAPPEVLISDELIRDRREEAAREDRD